MCSSLEQRVALVTGANKGIGREIARKLGAEPNLRTVLACRSERLGTAAAEELRACGCDVSLQRLILTDTESIAGAARHLRDEYGKLDILVNNAAICFNDPTLYGKVAHTPFEQQAGISVRTNFFGTLEVTRAMLPLLRASSSPRVVNVASAAGRLSILRSQDLVDAFTAPALSVPQLEQLMREFVEDVEAGVHAEKGAPLHPGMLPRPARLHHTPAWPRCCRLGQHMLRHEQAGTHRADQGEAFGA